MKNRIIIGSCLAVVLALAAASYGGEDIGLAAGAWLRGFSKNSSSQVAENITVADTYAIEIATGSLTSLSFRLRGYPTTGFFGAASLSSIVVLGAEAMRWSATQTFVRNGTAALPGLSFMGDPNTGFYAAADRIDATCGGLSRAFFTTLGFTSGTDITSGGYANNTPMLKGIVASSTTPNHTWLGDLLSGLGRFTKGEPSMVASGVEAMRFTDAGNTSITNFTVASNTYLMGETLLATTTDHGAYTLQLSGDAYQAGNIYEMRAVSGSGYFWIHNGATGHASTDGLYVGMYGGNDYLFWGKDGSPIIFGTNDNEVARIESDGEVLIATSTDAGNYKLQVKGDTYLNGNLLTTGLINGASAIASEAYVTAAIAAIPGIAISGDAYTLTEETASYSLPLNGSSRLYSLADDQVYHVDALVKAKLVASSEAVIWEFHVPICSNGGAPFIFGTGAGASATYRDDWMNDVGAANRYDCYFVVGSPGFAIVASGPIGAVYEVVKLEVN